MKESLKRRKIWGKDFLSVQRSLRTSVSALPQNMKLEKAAPEVYKLFSRLLKLAEEFVADLC